MLYATTRNKTETYTANPTLHRDFSGDGGLFVPFKLPVIGKADREILKTFGENVAYVLNLFFGSNLTGWDVDCIVGRSAMCLKPVSRRVLVAELWNNPQSSYSYIEACLYQKLCAGQPENKTPLWPQIAIRIAVLFGVTSQIDPTDREQLDVAVSTGDFSQVMAVWYAKKMGLPVRKILCICNENSGPWDFLHRGELNTAAPVIETSTPLLDTANPLCLEMLIYETLGQGEAVSYAEVSQKGGLYRVRPDMLPRLNNTMFASVVGDSRIESVIGNVYRASGYVLDAYGASVYGGLQDYRAKAGESNLTLLLSQRSPVLDAGLVCKATGLSREALLKHTV